MEHGKLAPEPGMVEEDHHGPGNVEGGESSKLDGRGRIYAVKYVHVHEPVQPAKPRLIWHLVNDGTVLIQHSAVRKPGRRSRKDKLYHNGNEVDPAGAPHKRVQRGPLLVMSGQVSGKEEGERKVGKVGNSGEDVEDGVGEAGEETVGEGEEEMMLNGGQDAVVGLARHVKVGEVADLAVELEHEEVGEEREEGQEQLLVADLPRRLEDAANHQTSEALSLSEAGLKLSEHHPLRVQGRRGGGGVLVYGLPYRSESCN